MLGQISYKNCFMLIDLAATSAFLLYHVYVQKTTIYILSNE